MRLPLFSAGTLFVGVMLTACAASPTVSNTCVDIAHGNSPLPPCWLERKPSSGLVLNGPKGVKSWGGAKQDLLLRAMGEFANTRFGQEVSSNAVLFKGTEIDGSGNVQVNHKQARLTEFRTSNGSVNVKAEIKDYFYYPQTEKLWIWVVEK